MSAPAWLASVVTEFGRSAGIGGLALNDRGVAALKFETGMFLRLEYVGGNLVVAMTVPSSSGSPFGVLERFKRLMAYSNPKARYGFRVRTGFLSKSQSFVLATVLAERDVTLPQVNGAFAVLWRLANEIGGAA
jgi:type III secretion system chaperone SycN